ncbi:MAG: NAD(P)-dependent oxidoreductase [Saprospiraceae bacterium]
MSKVLISDGVHPLLIEGLEADGYHCDYQANITLEETRKIISNYEGLIINSKIIMDRGFIDEAKQLKFVGRLGSGMEIVDIPYARSKGIAVLKSPEGNRNAVAEHALGMLLSLTNKLMQADREVRQKSWNREGNRGIEIMGKTVGLIGFGHTGSQFARKLSGMGVKILAHDKYKKGFAKEFPFVKETDISEIKQQADIISFHLPLTAETNYLLDEKFINSCKDGLIVINTSRGGIVKTTALLAALQTGKLGGACLDVFENEKPDRYTATETALYDTLFALDQVVLSTHVAGWTKESKERLASVLLAKIRKVTKP